MRDPRYDLKLSGREPITSQSVIERGSVCEGIAPFSQAGVADPMAEAANQCY